MKHYFLCETSDEICQDLNKVKYYLEQLPEIPIELSNKGYAYWCAPTLTRMIQKLLPHWKVIDGYMDQRYGKYHSWLALAGRNFYSHSHYIIDVQPIYATGPILLIADNYQHSYFENSFTFEPDIIKNLNEEATIALHKLFEVAAISSIPDYLHKRGGWTKGQNARNKFGEGVGVESPEAVCFCSRGALEASSPTNGICYLASVFLVKFVKSYGYNSLVAFNDANKTRKKDVIAVFDAGIAELESK